MSEEESMLKESVAKALNEQIRREFGSAYVYLSMAAYFERESLPGCATWMRVQAREETAHAMRLFDFIHDRGGRVALLPIEAPPGAFPSPLEVFRAALEHERWISASIHDLYALAGREGDVATQSHLLWFIDEQVEEEKSAAEVVDRFARAGHDAAAVLDLDRELGKREAEGAEE
jgi:ferritin